MRSAVYGRYWNTGGGAEKYGGVVAQHLARRGPVDLLTHDPVDLDWLAERLQLDLSGVGVRIVEDIPGAVTSAAADYDVFANTTYMSQDAAPHRRSIYIVHFPTSPLDSLPRWQRAIVKGVGMTVPALPAVQTGEGVYTRSPGMRGVSWTTGRGHLRITTETGRSTPVRLRFGNQRPGTLGPVEVEAYADGVRVGSVVLERRGWLRDRIGVPLRIEVTSPSPGQPVDVELRSGTFRPADLIPGNDTRTLGVPVQWVRVAGGVRSHLASLHRAASARQMPLDWIDTYGVVVANSEFTRGWIRTYWDRDSVVLFPPVTMFEPSDKAKVILNAGRFFPADRGHSKKQLEMVQAFRQLCDGGVEGWTLRLVGGCAPDGEGYLDQVRRAAEGYPVELSVNATGEELARRMGEASIYWHASGLGETRPDRLEHFGITTVEAMSAGAVPVVIGLAGQLETVRDGVDGYHFTEVRDLVRQTRRLIDDPGLLARMSESASTRARDFSIEAFSQRLDGLVAELGTP